MKRDKALKIAETLMGRLRPVCARIEVMGSIRRGKEDVKDIELLAIPDMTPPPPPRLEFGKPKFKVFRTRLDMVLEEMFTENLIRRHKDGFKYKKLEWIGNDRIMVDLFLVSPPATWGVQAVIRTGPAEFSHWCVTSRRSGGALPNGYRVENGAVWEKDETENMTGFETEQEFLDFLGLGWVEPGERVAGWKK